MSRTHFSFLTICKIITDRNKYFFIITCISRSSTVHFSWCQKKKKRHVIICHYCHYYVIIMSLLVCKAETAVLFLFCSHQCSASCQATQDTPAFMHRVKSDTTRWDFGHKASSYCLHINLCTYFCVQHIFITFLFFLLVRYFRCWKIP